MPIVNGYCTLEELKAEIDLSDSVDDTRLERYITAISRLIDEHCGYPLRRFYADADANQVRHFDTAEVSNLWIMDLAQLTSLKVDPSGDGTFEETWTQGTDFITAPRTAAADGRPFTSIEIMSSAGRSFPTGIRRGIEITGKWGWPAVPAVVTEACLLQAQKLFKSHEAPFGIANVPTLDGGGMRLLSRLHPEVELLLHHLRRLPIGVS